MTHSSQMRSYLEQLGVMLEHAQEVLLIESAMKAKRFHVGLVGAMQLEVGRC